MNIQVHVCEWTSPFEGVAPKLRVQQINMSRFNISPADVALLRGPRGAGAAPDAGPDVRWAILGGSREMVIGFVSTSHIFMFLLMRHKALCLRFSMLLDHL